MKKHLTLFFALAISTTLFGQSDSLLAVSKTSITNFVNHFNNEQWDEVVKLTNPKMFKLIPKDVLLSSYNQMKSGGLKFTTKLDTVSYKSSLIEHENYLYYKIGFSSTWLIKLSGPALSVKEQMITNFQTQYGKNNVSFKKESNTIIINCIKYYITETPKEKINWKVMDGNESEKQLVNAIIPNEVLSKL